MVINDDTVLRLGAVLAIFITSLTAACLPLYMVAYIPPKSSAVLSIIKLFGSGVIVGTAFIHLLAPASDAFRNPCLSGLVTEYDWPEGICLAAVFAMFVLDIMMRRSSSSEQPFIDSTRDHAGRGRYQTFAKANRDLIRGEDDYEDHGLDAPTPRVIESAPLLTRPHGTQLSSIITLELGIIFHSVFIGLTLAVAGSEFMTLFVVLTLHQMFEGFAIGSRLAEVEWSKLRRWTPYIMASAYAATTPGSMAVALALRSSIDMDSQAALIVNGIADAVSAGILIYASLVELMARDFVFSDDMISAPRSKLISSVAAMLLGATLMAVLGKWA